MKQFTTGIVLLFLFAIRSYAQDTTTIWYNASWDKTVKDLATYYGKSWKEGKSFKVHDYFINGNLQMTGEYADSAHKTENGHFVYYHENGNKRLEGNYANNLRIGIWEEWYEGSEPYAKVPYTAGNVEGIVTRYYKSGKKFSVLSFLGDEVQESTYWDEDGNEIEQPLRLPADVLPTFREGGEQGMLRFLNQNLKYPKKARKARNSGRVVIKFVVDTDGSILHPIVVESADPLLDTEALRVVRAMPKWHPGKENGQLVKVFFTLPINFTLEE